MLTQTSETAIRALVLIALSSEDKLLTPKTIAERLDTSPTYMAKISGLLVKANILKSQRGATGGVTLARDASQITLLAIVEACQGLLVGNYCDDISAHPEPVCAFHTAMREAHEALLEVLTRWTLGDLVRRPGPSEEKATNCKMGFYCKQGNLVCLPRASSGAPIVMPIKAPKE